MTQADPVSAAQVRAAHAYAGVLLGADVAGPAADDAIAAFLRTLGSGAKASASPAGDETLLALTRLMTAVSMPDRSSPEDRRRAVWASIGSASHCTCREAAALLATRANGNIQPRESTALDEHLATCAECRELSVRSAAADAAFRRALTPPSGGGLGGLSGGPRVGAALLLILIAVAAGIYALSSGGSRSNRASAASAPAHTQTAEAIALTVPTVVAPTSPHHRVHRPARVTPARRHVTHVTHHTSPVNHPTPTVTVAAATSSPSTAAASSATSAATGAAPTAATEAPAAATAAPASTTAAAATTAAAPSTAAQVSGPSSLPADSAPQQGIGSLTSTTP